MSNNYQVIIDTINQAYSKIYKAMNDYLENIINAPSTINRIFKYYAIGLPSDPNIQKRWIMFNEKIVREYELVLPKMECGIDGIKVDGELL